MRKIIYNFTSCLLIVGVMLFGLLSCKQKSTDTPLKIVAIMPMTGPVAYYGEQE